MNNRKKLLLNRMGTLLGIIETCKEQLEEHPEDEAIKLCIKQDEYLYNELKKEFEELN